MSAVTSTQAVPSSLTLARSKGTEPVLERVEKSNTTKPYASPHPSAHVVGTIQSISPSPSFSQFLSPRSTLTGCDSPNFHPDSSYFFFSTSLGGGAKSCSNRSSDAPSTHPNIQASPALTTAHANPHSIDFGALESILNPRFENTLVPYLKNDSLFDHPKAHYESIQAYEVTAKATFYSDRTGLLQSLTAASIVEFLENQSQIWTQLKNTREYFWFDICQPNQSDLRVLSLLFDLHPLTVEDISSQDPFEKCESFEHYLFYCLRPCDPLIPFSSLAPPKSAFFPDVSQSYSTLHSAYRASKESGIFKRYASHESVDSPISSLTAQVNPVQKYMVDPNSPWYEKNHVYVLHFPNGVVTLHAKPVPSLQSTFAKMAWIYKKSESGQGPTWTPDYFLFLLLESILEEAKLLLAHLQLECDVINNDLVLYLKAEDRPVILSRIARTRKRLLYLQRLLRPKLDILDQFVDRYSESMTAQIETHKVPVEECIIRPWTFSNLVNLKEIASYTLKQTNSLYEALQHSMATYCDQVNISMTVSSVETDRLMKRLTVLACVLLPPSLIVDFYGMNIPLPGSKRFSFTSGHMGPLLIHATVMMSILLVSYMIIRRMNGRNEATATSLSSSSS